MAEGPRERALRKSEVQKFRLRETAIAEQGLEDQVRATT